MAETTYELSVCESCQYAVNQVNTPKWWCFRGYKEMTPK